MNNFNYHSQTQLSITKEPIFPRITDRQYSDYKNAFKILFAGDLILLEDQVKNAYNGKEYDFSSCFEYTRSYISAADFSIGVFEGPMAGGDAGYSSSNYADGKKLEVNFPDSWADAIMDAGFDFVTTANNHAMDKGLPGLIRTCSVLKTKGLDYAGTYVSEKDKADNHIRIVCKEGIKLALLTYTFKINHYKADDLLNGDISYITSVLLPQSSPNYGSVLETVKADFEEAKQCQPDLIIVLPHWGTQFADYPSANQRHWEKIFKELGADIILGDHTHSVQPTYIEEFNGKMRYTCYCPGNYANIFREHDGDCSAMTEVYIDRNTKEIIGGAIIPMWTASQISGNYRPLPIYRIMTDIGAMQELTTYDFQRVSEAQEHICKIMLGEHIPIQLIQEKYYFNEKGFLRTKADSISVSADAKSNPAYLALSSAKNVCFVGDSITEGTRNGGIGYYEPLEHLISGNVTKCGWGSSTTKTLLNRRLDTITSIDADLYVIAIGTNDVRYRKEEKCAMTPEEYTEKLQNLRQAILDRHPSAAFVFIAPWTATDGDKQSKLPFAEKLEMLAAYADALKLWTVQNGDVYINPNPYIAEKLNLYPRSKYLLDAIHPNASAGIRLYAEAILNYYEESPALTSANNVFDRVLQYIISTTSRIRMNWKA